VKNTQSFNVTGSSGVSFGNVSQTVGSSPPEPRAEEPRAVKVLFLAANPAGTSPLRLDQEVKAVGEALRSPRPEARFELLQSWAVGYREIQDELLRHEPDIVHLSGHGASTGRLLLEDNAFRDLASPHRQPAADPEETTRQALGRLFSVARGRIRCVVLNACHSEPVARAIAEHIDCVVGMSTAVGDTAAIRFSWAFYNALAYGRSVKDAFDLASAQADLGGIPGGDVPRLLALRADPMRMTFA
jgi:hypothetical protein